MANAMYAMQLGIPPPPEAAPRGCACEKKFYDKTGLLPLTSNKYKLYRLELRSCIETFIKAPSSSSDTISKGTRIGDETWATNVTFVDLDWQRVKPFDEGEPEIDVAHNVLECGENIVRLGLAMSNPTGLFDYVKGWFFVVAAALGELKHRIKIETCVGGITAVLEQIKYGVIGHRQQTAKNGGPSTSAALSALNDIDNYPQIYDRIHLSNIPDYIGGTLTSFLYASPLTFADEACYITSTNLRNPPRFPTIASFDNEYFALSKPSDLEAVFRVSMQPLPDPNEEMPTCRYHIWRQKKDSTTILSRDRLSA